MELIPPEQVVARLRLENPWWNAPHRVIKLYRDYKPRAYLALFLPLICEARVRRAVLLMGPRRIGKTVMIHHAIDELIHRRSIPPHNVFYVSVDHPIYNGLSLEDLVAHSTRASGANPRKEPCYVFFDEIQYLRDWEVHLKRLVDDWPRLRCIASGSAAAALRLKSTESGAGRFTEFLLPPLTFHEYLTLLGKHDLVRHHPEPAETSVLGYDAPNIHALNEAFLHYLNFGGYPEVIFSEAVQADPQRYIKSDIIDKVLLRDLPSLYGISDVQELNYLFTTLAYNTGNEVSLDKLSQNSGVAKNTIKRYVQYLEAAFLVRCIHRIDRHARRFKRANFFKIYLTNPSIRSALFAPIVADDPHIGNVVETAVYSQWFHSDHTLNYARWPDGEVDIVSSDATSVHWAAEVKWTDRHIRELSELDKLVTFCQHNRLESALVTTRSVTDNHLIRNVRLHLVPAAVYCYAVGRNLVKGKLRGPPIDAPRAPKRGHV